MTVYHRPREGAKKLGIGVSTFWALAKTDPDFPELIKLGPKTTVVSDDALDAYVARKASRQRADVPAPGSHAH